MLEEYSAERGMKVSVLCCPNTPDHVLRIWDRIERSLRENDHWSKKKFYYGYILGLLVAGKITEDDHDWLLTSIEIYKAPK